MEHSPYSEANNNVFVKGTHIHNTSYEPYITQIVANAHSNNFTLYLPFWYYTHNDARISRGSFLKIFHVL